MTPSGRARQIKELLGSSFWFVPLIIILAAILLATVLVIIDNQFEEELSEISGFLFSGGAESARSILSIIAGGMLGVAGTVFSITLVVLTLATSQLGPRLLRLFMHQHINQVVLGTYVATFVYCLLILGSVNSVSEVEFVPRISILMAMMLAVANIFLLIIFIHHVSVSIQADQVISDVAKNLNKTVRKLYPEKLGVDAHELEDSVDLSAYQAEYDHCIEVRSSGGGYLETIDNDYLIEWAVGEDVWMELYLRPGDFVIEGMPIARIYAKEEREDMDWTKALERHFFFGDKRTPWQDSEFAVHQMVEVAARALSPGVNDPYTAITCIDKLSAILAYLCKAQFPSPYRLDEDGQLRVVARILDFEGMLDASFNQIRQYGADSPSIIIHLMGRLVNLHQVADQPHTVRAILRHARMVHRAGQTHLKEPNDRRDLQRRYLRFQEK